MTTSLVHVGDAQLYVSDFGSGEPVVLVQTALTADELLPLARESAWRTSPSSSTTVEAMAAAVPPAHLVRSRPTPQTARRS